MRNLFRAFLAVAILFSMVITAQAAEDKKEKPKKAEAEIVEFVSVIECINPQAGEAILKNPMGNLVKIKADPKVKNLDKVKVGDKVKVKLTKTLAISVQKSKTKKPASKAGEMDVYPDGDMPSKITIATIESSAIVKGVDYKKRTLDLEDVNGEKFTVDVPEKVKNFNNIKKGDEILVVYTQSVAVDVVPADK